MTDKPHDRRRHGIEFLEQQLGHAPEGYASVSKLYRPEESWTGSEVWWFDLAMNKLRSSKQATWYLVCENETGGGFSILSVPVSYILGNLAGLDVVEEKVRLHLSAREEDRFTDLRSQGRVAFGQWLRLT